MSSLDELLYSILERHAIFSVVAHFLMVQAVFTTVGSRRSWTLLWSPHYLRAQGFLQYPSPGGVEGSVLGEARNPGAVSPLYTARSLGLILLFSLALILRVLHFPSMILFHFLHPCLICRPLA